MYNFPVLHFWKIFDIIYSRNEGTAQEQKEKIKKVLDSFKKIWYNKYRKWDKEKSLKPITQAQELGELAETDGNRNYNEGEQKHREKNTNRK